MPRRNVPESVVFVAEVHVSGRTADKLRYKHGIDADEVAALVSSPPSRVGRRLRDERGTRVVIDARLADFREVRVVLYAAGDDEWYLASAYVKTREWRA
jgi:hypothetical protein